LRVRPTAAVALIVLLPGCPCWVGGPDHQADLPRILEAFHDCDSQVVLVAAHRGEHLCHPENSLPAIEAAILLGADVVEVDVRGTRDGVLVLMHDDTVDRTTDGSGHVRELSFAQIRQLHLRAGLGISDESVPSLREALLLAKGRVMLDLDIKSAAPASLMEVVEETDCLDQVIFFAGNGDLLASIRELDPRAILMPRAYSSADVDLLIERFHPPIIHVDESFLTPDIASRISADGGRVWINAVGCPDVLGFLGMAEAGYGALLRDGANVLQTDRAGAMVAYLEKEGLHP